MEAVGDFWTYWQQVSVTEIYFQLIFSRKHGVIAMKPLLISGSLFLLASCASPQPVTDHNNPLTHGNVQLHLEAGQTTKNDVLETFGAPNVTTRDGVGQEVWTYQRQAQISQSSSQSAGWTILLAGGSASASGFESTSRMMTLIIKFDENDVVTDFRSRASNF